MMIGKSLSRILTIVFIISTFQPSFAIESNEEFALDKPTIKLHKKSGESKKMAQDFIRKEKKWKIGLNERDNEKGDFFVSIGTSGIAFNNSYANFGDARQDAFDIAFLQSKKQFIKFMGQQISTKIINERKEGSYAQPPIEDPSAMEDFMNELSSFEEGEKLRILINLELDQALKEAGYEDPTSEEAVEEAEKIIKSKEFNKTIEAAAEHRIAGYQTYKVFEISDGQKGNLTVIGLWSNKLNKLADALSTGGDIPANTPKKPLYNQIPSQISENDLQRWAFSYGARMTSDEKGNPSIISFGHASPIFDDTDEWIDACDQAILQAESYIAIFANEIVSYKENVNKSQNVKIFEDNANINGVKEEISSVKNYYKKLASSGYIDTAGIEILDTIEIQHPANEQALECIAAIGWSTSLRDAGEKLEEINENAEKIKNKEKSKNEDTNEDDENGTAYTGESDSADDDF